MHTEAIGHIPPAGSHPEVCVYACFCSLEPIPKAFSCPTGRFNRTLGKRRKNRPYQGCSGSGIGYHAMYHADHSGGRPGGRRAGRGHHYTSEAGDHRKTHGVVSHREGSNARSFASARSGRRPRTSLPGGIFLVSMVCLVALVENFGSARAFAPAAFLSAGMRRNVSKRRTFALGTYIGDDESAEGDSGTNDGDQDSASLVWDDLSWRVEKLRLEEANTKRFLKAKPRFLPYDECCKWVQAWNRWDSEEDWNNWIMEGEKRNSYIPARPEEYYGRLGQWISWDHFLGKSDTSTDTTSAAEKSNSRNAGEMGNGGENKFQ